MKLLASLAAAVALLVAGCASSTQPSAPPAAAQPALWKVSDEDTTLYLFGTIHVLPKDYQWQTPRFREALAKSDGLVIETVLTEGREGLAKTMGELSISPGLPPLLERVSAEKRPRLQALIARTGLPPVYFDRLETWAAALALVGATLTDLGLEGGSGVEEQVQQTFRAAGKPISGLETPAEQLGYMDRLPEADQRAFLETLLDDSADMREDFDAMLAAWARGDEKAIAETFDEEMEVTSAIRDALLLQRNANWAQWIESRMAQPGTLLIAVGAGHLAGKDSVTALLEKQGLKVERVE